MASNVEAEKSELYEAVIDSLREKGVLDKLSNEVRAEILSILKNPNAKREEEEDKKNLIGGDNFVINQLFKEYLDWNGFANTADVLSAESGQPKSRSDRVDLEKSVGLECGPNSRKVPLIYSILGFLRNNRR